MNKKSCLSLLCVWAISATLSGPAEAQSTLEYTTLMTTVAGAAKMKKEKAQGQDQGETMKQLYGESNQAMTSKGASLLGQVGTGVRPAEGAPAPVTNEPAVETPPEDLKQNTAVKVYLKTGKVIEGALLGHDKDSVKVDCAGIPVTYFNEEIDKIVE